MFFIFCSKESYWRKVNRINYSEIIKKAKYLYMSGIIPYISNKYVVGGFTLFNQQNNHFWRMER
jgi:hypothetical protein